MAGRGRLPTTLEGRSLHTPGATRHGANPVRSHVAGHRQVELLHHPELLETKIAAQAAEIKQLVGDNQRLVSAHAVLREELVVAQQEVQRLKAHMVSLKTESDIQIRVLVDKIARAEVNIKAGEDVKKDVEVAFKEAQSTVIARKELTVKIQETTKELQKARDDIKSLPDLHTELESLRREHQRLHATFEYEKSSNIEQVEQLQAMEQKLILMAKEVDKLRIDVLNAEKRANAPVPYAGGYMNPNFPNPPPMLGNVAYVDCYARLNVPMNHHMGMWPIGEQINAHGSSGSVAPAGLTFPTSGSAGVPPNGVAAVADNGDAPVPTSTEAAVPASVVASASTSGGDAATHSEGDGYVQIVSRKKIISIAGEQSSLVKSSRRRVIDGK